MLQWLLILSFTMGGSSPTIASSTSEGPTSPSESEFLWKAGQDEALSGKYQDAAFHLARLVDRYPGHSAYLKAHFLLGRTLVELGRPKEAVKPLKYYINDSGKSSGGVDGRIWLGRAYLDSKNFHEAFLIAKEVENLKSQADPSSQAEALVIKARAQVGLNQDGKASQTLDSAKKLIQESVSTVMATAQWTDLQIKTRTCSKLASVGPLDESQLRDQLERRGNCILEALILFKKTAEAQDPKWSEKARLVTWEAFESYSKACEKPLIPKATRPKNRTKTQLAKYQKELTAFLIQDCQSKYDGALDLLHSWKPVFPAGSAEALSQLTGSVEKLSKKNYDGTH